ncbi:MAG: hypothetical protein KGH59_04285 [Candidatus Micrarchaeota archaeon]|nr:hypothetical protein [Candidatus Micrarchaeota archaeon]MDE1804970.1 hypothetical protein [Candidatus Micrarchaeota archaeon]MDE1847182.1 hypothetical protein [Candidatus Micrarchaeota archaeon]
MKGQLGDISGVGSDNRWGFLISYGWIVIVAIIVIVVILNIGIFKPTPTCITQPGFFCQTPIMNTSGTVNIQFGQIVSSQIVITSVGCSQNVSTFPNTTPVDIPVVTGQIISLDFACGFGGQTRVGNAFKGYLWITYDTQSSSDLLMQFGEVLTSVSTTSPILIRYPGAAFDQTSADYARRFNSGAY